MKHTNKDTLAKGVKFLAGALPLIFIGPSIVFSAFNNQDKPLYWPILILGIMLSMAAIYLIFKGIMTLLKALFDE
ncbi:DUF6095 family protein [Psychroflexus montanilacus]|uniref:DUF6095 family protein n=1 Tax=Psychroflexus montanilacus TaxID=2873598 RepID=UPI001CCCDF58|nr:DUF6095 family protein [Psychroflexus montanilacus]MBZ9651749.1 DUF6095 family protein [Psychroflexus montanilacus]